MFESLASCFAFRCNTSLNVTARLTSSSRVATLCPELFACLLRAKSAQLKAKIMKSAWIVWIALLVLGAALEAQQKYTGDHALLRLRRKRNRQHVRTHILF